MEDFFQDHSAAVKTVDRNTVYPAGDRTVEFIFMADDRYQNEYKTGDIRWCGII